MSRWLLVVALLGGGCDAKKEEAVRPQFEPVYPTQGSSLPPPQPPGPDPVSPPAAPDAAPAGSRDVPGERGVPLDRAVLGSLPHPFGALELIKPTSSREEILAAVPAARRDANDDIVASVGVDDLVALIAIDGEDLLDGVTIKMPYDVASHELLAEAWGKPTDYNAWFNRTQRWRADWDDATLTIGPFMPLVEILGAGPEGLTETKPIIGATVTELQQRFGKRLVAHPDASKGMGFPDETQPETTYALILPATEVCRFDTAFTIRVRAGRAVSASMTQCYDDEAMRRAALAAFERRWGRAVPGRTSDDHPVFVFTRGQRRFEMSAAPDWEPEGAWRIEITAAGGARRR